MPHYKIQTRTGWTFGTIEATSPGKALQRLLADDAGADPETDGSLADWIIREVPAPITLDDALDGWNKLEILSHETAQDFADAFLASPDSDDLAGDPSIMDIECACRARWDWLRACAA